MISVNGTPALLAVDAGNTQIKWGLLLLEPGDGALALSEGVISDRVTPAIFDLNTWAQDVQAVVQGVIVSSVRTAAETRALCEEIQQVFPEAHCLQLLPQSFTMPFSTQYELSELGADRLMNILGLLALSKAVGQDHDHSLWIAVDAGTCCTVDVYHSEDGNPDAGYLGGWILPGLQMQAKAMTAYTARLPDISEKLSSQCTQAINQIGTSTETSMLKGLQLGYPAMILGVLNSLFLSNKQVGDFQCEHTVILTGGDATYLLKALSPYLPNCRVERQLNFIGLRQAWQLLY
ncbi:MAG: type III pantothenate kinase [Cyanobacteria bacterium]|nr:type III pantothenate kinase [Cyanobacteriota bacterium]